MRNIVLSKRYADAFLNTASASIGFKRGFEELQLMKRIYHDNPDFRRFIESLQITSAEKCGMIDTVFADGFSENSRDFLKFLIVKNRIELFDDIAEYARIKYAHGDEIDAQLKTSYPLDTDVLLRIKNDLEARFRKKLHMYVELDSDLLGGIYVRIGNTIIDGTVKRRLSDLREKLTNLKVA